MRTCQRHQVEADLRERDLRIDGQVGCEVRFRAGEVVSEGPFHNCLHSRVGHFREPRERLRRALRRRTHEGGIAVEPETTVSAARHADAQVHEPGRIGLGSDRVDVRPTARLAPLDHFSPLHALRPIHRQSQTGPRFNVTARIGFKRALIGKRFCRAPAQVAPREQRGESFSGTIRGRRDDRRRCGDPGPWRRDRETGAGEDARRRQRADHVAR